MLHFRFGKVLSFASVALFVFLTLSSATASASIGSPITCPILTQLVGIDASAQAQTGQSVELAYDDGDVDGQMVYSDFGVSGEGPIFAVLFSPPYKTSQVTEALFYIAKSPAPFEIHIMNETWKAIFQEEVTPDAHTGWHRFDISAKDVIVSGDFVVGIKFLTPDTNVFGFDMSDPDGRSYIIHPDGNREKLKGGLFFDEMDFMIRAVVKIAKIKTSLTMSPSGTSVAIGEEVAISGSLSPAMGGKAVHILTSSTDGITFTRAAEVATDADGHYVSKVGFPEAGRYYVKASWDGDEENAASESSPAEVTVTESVLPYVLTGISGMQVSIILLTIGAITVLALAVRSRRHAKVQTPLKEQKQTASPEYCSNCGHPLASEDTFCQSCGTKQ